MSSLAECFRSLILRLFITCFQLFNSQAIIPRVEITFGEKVMKDDWRVASLLQQFFVMNFVILDAWIPFHLLARSSWIVLSILFFCVDHLWFGVALLPRFLLSYESLTPIFIHWLAFILASFSEPKHGMWKFSIVPDWICLPDAPSVEAKGDHVFVGFCDFIKAKDVMMNVV